MVKIFHTLKILKTSIITIINLIVAVSVLRELKHDFDVPVNLPHGSFAYSMESPIFYFLFCWSMAPAIEKL